MDAKALAELENAQNTENQKFFEANDALQAAKNQVADAEAAYKEAGDKLNRGEVSYEEFLAAEQAVRDAKRVQEDAEKNCAEAAENAEKAREAVEEKKQEIRDNRKNDKSYVVHCARIECPFGMRKSYLALENTHGVFTRQVPQMTVKDVILDKNIINFGGCHSRENPSVQAEIEKTNALIEDEKDWRDDLVGFFTKAWEGPSKAIGLGVKAAKFGISAVKHGLHSIGIGKEKSEEEKEKERQEREKEEMEEMSSDFLGECTAQFPEDGEWLEGDEKVFINGKPVLLRRCSIMCNYGGCVTILLSGQPEQSE